MGRSLHPIGQPQHLSQELRCTVDASSKVDLTLSYDTVIQAGSNQVKLTGTLGCARRAPRNSAGSQRAVTWSRNEKAPRSKLKLAAAKTTQSG